MIPLDSQLIALTERTIDLKRRLADNIDEASEIGETIVEVVKRAASKPHSSELLADLVKAHGTAFRYFGEIHAALAKGRI